MHAEKYVKPTILNARPGSASDHSLAPTTTPPPTTAAAIGYAKPAIKASTAATGQPANHSSARTNMYHNHHINNLTPRINDFPNKV